MGGVIPAVTCDVCGAKVLVLELVDAEHGRLLGESVAVDPVPSLHGYYRRRTLYRRDAVQEDHRRPGWYRPHSETCGQRPK